MNNSRNFVFSASPTGSQSENCTVSGVFQWDFNQNTQRLGERLTTIISLNPERIFNGTVPRFHFTARTFDFSVVGASEGHWPLGDGYRDTLRLQVVLYATFLDNLGNQQVQPIHTEECYYAGNRYYV